MKYKIEKNMKQKLLIAICFMFVFISSKAQTVKDYSYYNHKLDSLITAYSVDVLKKDDGIHLFKNQGDKLTAKDKLKLIKKIEGMFKQTKYTNLYLLGSELINNLYFYHKKDNTVEIQQKLMELYLTYYFYPEQKKSIVQYTDNNSIANYSPKAKKEILRILKGEKPKQTFDLWLKYNQSIPWIYKTLDSWGEAEQIMKKREIQNDDVLKQVRDSLLIEYLNHKAKKEFESLKIDDNLIRVIGLLDMKECIPYLQQELSAIKNDKCRERSFRFALARLGDKEQKAYILANFMNYPYFVRDDFAYFRDDDMMWKFIEVNYHSEKMVKVLSEHDWKIPSKLRTILDVYHFLKDVPKELEMQKETENMNECYIWAKSLYEWLIANKDVVEFDYVKGSEYTAW